MKSFFNRLSISCFFFHKLLFKKGLSCCSFKTLKTLSFVHLKKPNLTKIHILSTFNQQRNQYWVTNCVNTQHMGNICLAPNIGLYCIAIIVVSIYWPKNICLLHIFSMYVPNICNVIHGYVYVIELFHMTVFSSQWRAINKHK